MYFDLWISKFKKAETILGNTVCLQFLIRSTRNSSDIFTNFFFTIFFRKFFSVCQLKKNLWQIFIRKLVVSKFKIGKTKGQIEPKTIWACLGFSQKTNERISFVCREKAKKQTKQIRSFFGGVYCAQICFWFYLTFTYLISQGQIFKSMHFIACISAFKNYR